MFVHVHQMFVDGVCMHVGCHVFNKVFSSTVCLDVVLSHHGTLSRFVGNSHGLSAVDSSIYRVVVHKEEANQTRKSTNPMAPIVFLRRLDGSFLP